MIYLELFINFFKIGIFTFGGGYAMISLVRESVLANNWLTEARILDMIAVSESTPGPIAVNMATFVGSEQGGILGSVVATAGVVLPSFIIILIIAALATGFMKKPAVQAALEGVRPSVVGLILATGITMFFSQLLGFTTIKGGFAVDFRAIAVFAIICVIAFVIKKLSHKKPSPIIMILVSALLGVIFY